MNKFIYQKDYPVVQTKEGAFFKEFRMRMRSASGNRNG